MRHYPTDESDWSDLEKMGAEPWMIETLKCNPSYPHWGPHEDYMTSKSGWNAPIFYDDWATHDLTLDELNEVVHFYFQINRASETCPDCLGTGHNKAVHQLEKDWYDHDGKGRRWMDQLEQPEVDALWDAERLWKFKTKPTPEEVNKWAREATFGHDAINQYICVQARAKAQGIWTSCPTCAESGYVFTEPAPHLSLVYWLCHPRKGASRGVEIKHIEREDLPSVRAFLTEARQRNHDRFAGIDLLPA